MSCALVASSQRGGRPTDMTSDLDDGCPPPSSSSERETEATSPAMATATVTTTTTPGNRPERAESSSSLSSTSSSSSSSSSSASSSSSSSNCCMEEERVEKMCDVEGCEKSALKSRRYQLLPWKCKYHRNKTYKETYKRRKALASQELHNGVEVRVASLERPADRLGTATSATAVAAATAAAAAAAASAATARHRTGEQTSMLEQVLNEKKMALMQSPVVLAFLQKQQQKRRQEQQHLQQQPKQWGLQQVHGFGQPSQR